MAEVAALMAQANSRLAEAERSRVARRTIAEAERVLAGVNDDVQKAGAAIKADNYAAAEPALAGVKERIEGVIAKLDQTRGTQSSRRRR